MPTPTANSSPPSTTSSAASTTHTVQVGPKEDPHQYVPHSVTADVGDFIVFEFYPRNHSVVQADYQAPCVPANGDYFFSGIKDDFNEENGQLVGDPPTWTMTVESAEPQFFYCTAIDSCQVNGMVGVINPNSTMTWETQYRQAIGYPYMVVPGGSIPAEGDQPTTSDTPSSSDSSSSLSGGAIAGIVIGCVAFLGILAALFFLLGRNRVYKQWISSQDGRNERTARWAFFGNTTGKSEMESSGAGASAGPDHGMGGGPVDYGRQAYSPPPQGMYSPTPQQGHWSWDGSVQGHPQQVQQSVPGMPVPAQQHTQPARLQPSELEATSVK